MSYSIHYLKQVSLLLEVLPVINMQACFALKGGTAINLFVRDMPRLSVDIDLTYLPIEPREEFLKNIALELEILAANIKKQGNGRYQINKIFTRDSKQISKLIVSENESRIIIEPNFVLRGSVFACETYDLCQHAQNEFLNFYTIKTLSFADLYGGKICAALARQHPRDLFDIRLLLDNEGITDKIRQAFVVYLASNSRPMHELLNPNPNIQDMKKIYEEAFLGMTLKHISYEQLIETRYELIKFILTSLNLNERQFLFSVKEGNPDFQLLPIPGINNLPGIGWKSFNVEKMERNKRIESLNKLKKILEL